MFNLFRKNDMEPMYSMKNRPGTKKRKDKKSDTKNVPAVNTVRVECQGCDAITMDARRIDVAGISVLVDGAMEREEIVRITTNCLCGCVREAFAVFTKNQIYDSMKSVASAIMYTLNQELQPYGMRCTVVNIYDVIPKG